MPIFQIFHGNLLKQEKWIEGEQITIGRIKDCDLILDHPSLAPMHAVIKRNYLTTEIFDLNDESATKVNGSNIKKCTLREGDEIFIGVFKIIYGGNKKKQNIQNSTDTSVDEDIFFDLKVKLHRLLIERIDLKRVHDRFLRSEAMKTVHDLIKEMDTEIPEYIDRNILQQQLLDDSLGLGPLEDLIKDQDITEIMVNRKDQIFIEKFGKLYKTSKKFLSDDQILAVIHRIVAPLGRTINESKPMVDARLPDGSRVNAIIYPLAIQGPTLTIRKFSKIIFDIKDLIKFSTLNEAMGIFLKICVENKKNIIISGGAGSGKTTLLNIISSFVPDGERIITVEDAAELNLPQEHLVSLEARPPNIEGKGEVTFRDLVINSLRMRPDRIIVGECRGGEAIDMLQAMNTGHEGSLTTIHANSPRDCLARLETMVLMSGMELPSRAIRDQITCAIDIIVQTQRFKDGTRKITHINEVTGMEGDVILLQDIYRFRQTSIDEQGVIYGKFVSSGVIPKFIEELREGGIEIPMQIFENK